MATTTASSLCGVSSSDSSDEDEHRRFLEAAVLDCHHSSSQNGGTGINGCSGNKSRLPSLQQRIPPTRPSLRPSKQETHEAENELNTTPEFRAHVGRKLSQVIDNMIDIGNSSKYRSQLNGVHNPDTSEGIRLFMKSSILVDNADSSSKRKPVKKRPVESSSSDSSEDERIASAAVSRDFIFKDTVNLSVTGHYSIPEIESANTEVIRLKTNLDCTTSDTRVKRKKKKKHKDAHDQAKSSIRSKSTDDDVKEKTVKETLRKCKKKKRKKEKDTT